MKILAVQNRMGIGDMIIFLPFIEAIAKKYKTSVSILVKENSKAEEYLSKNKNIEKIIYLDRNGKNGRHDGVLGTLKLVKDLKKYEFEQAYIFNSSLRYYLIAKMTGIKNIYQYPLFKKKQQHIVNAAKEFIKLKLGEDVQSNPLINLDDKKIQAAKKIYRIEDAQINILLGIGGSGPTKRIPAETFITFMEKATQQNNCKFFLATGSKKEEQIILNKILKSKFNDKCIPLDKLKINEILPIIKNCKIAICNDSSFSHLSAALNIPTIVLMADTPLLYGSYSPRMFPIIPDGEDIVKHDTLGKEKINPEKIFDLYSKLLN